MGSLEPSHWPLVLVLVLQLQSVKVQGIDPVSRRLRRLNEQFQQFRALTQARLDMLALNQNRNSSWGLESRVQALNDQYHHMSQDLKHLNHNTTQEIEGLREWSRKLEKKNKRIEGRMILMERNLRETQHQTQEEKPDLGQDLSNLTLELQGQEDRLAALQAQRDELLLGLRGLQESLKIQMLRVTRVEGRLGEFLHLNGGGNVRGSVREGESLKSNITPQEYHESRERSKTHGGGRPGRILKGHNQPRADEISQTKTDSPSQSRSYEEHATNHPKHTKAKKPRPQTNSQPQIPNPTSQATLYLPQRDPYHPLSQIQMGVQTRPYPIKQEQLQSRQSVPYRHAQVRQPFQPHSRPQKHPQSHHYSSWPQPLTQAKDRRNSTRVEAPEPQVSRVVPQPQSEPHQSRAGRWKVEEEEESETKVETSVIHNILNLPVRHKIPERPVPRKDATICNVDSMLFFPSASAENYVTFSLTLPHLPELSVCLWLRVEASHVGTLLSYATEDNDNQLVLYGRNSPSSSQSSYSSSPLSSTSYSASPLSLDFVIGDPVYRRLAMSSLLDARWHHLCILWSSIQGRFWHYSDRRLVSSGSNFRKGWEIPGGGSVVLGQEQDSVGGGFDPTEGFAGQMAGFRVWNRVLSPLEVEGVAEGRGVPRGVVLDMEDIEEVHGEVQQVACECLEHCAG
nr:PREDICTED: pentraxin-4 isoform X1 [Paralichthys olivaceus]